MRSEANCKLLRSHVLGSVPANVQPDFELDRCQPNEPFTELIGHPDARQVLVTTSVAEPPTHLEERVIGRGTANKVASDQTLEGQTTRERVSADSHNVTALRVIEILCVGIIKTVDRAVVVDDNLDLAKDRGKSRSQLFKGHWGLAQLPAGKSFCFLIPLLPKLIEQSLVGVVYPNPEIVYQLLNRRTGALLAVNADGAVNQHG